MVFELDGWSGILFAIEILFFAGLIFIGIPVTVVKLLNKPLAKNKALGSTTTPNFSKRASITGWLIGLLVFVLIVFVMRIFELNIFEFFGLLFWPFVALLIVLMFIISRKAR